jgi:hypothetical protein
MSRSSHLILSMAVALILASVLATPVRAQGKARLPTDQTVGVELVGETAGRRSPAPATDAPAVLEEDRLAPVSRLAKLLSRERAWLTPETLKELDKRALGLDELFEQAPRYVSVDDATYRIKLEKVGDGWGDFVAGRDPFVVFLTHEVYDGLGKDQALGYQNGEEMILFASDFKKLPAIALTFFQLTQEERPAAGERVVDLCAKQSIALGKARAALAAKPDGLNFARPVHAAKDVCQPEVAPTACNGIQLVCPATYQPYFVLSGLRVFENHEGCCFHGDPEIEIYPLRIDSVTGAGGQPNVTTQFVFSGRNIVDVAGRTRWLPDVDDGGALYSMNVALLSTNMTSQFAGLMVEDDGEAGKLETSNTNINVSQLLDAGFQIFQDIRNMDRFELLKDSFSLIDLLGLLNNDDDMFQPSLGATNSLFCNNALGGSFPRVFTLSSNEWEMQGYFACVNANCVPPPPPPPVCDPVDEQNCWNSGGSWDASTCSCNAGCNPTSEEVNNCINCCSVNGSYWDYNTCSCVPG